MISDLYQHRRAFWAYFAEQLPTFHARTEYGTEHSRWLTVGVTPLIVAHYVANNGVGLFVRGARGVRTGLIREILFPHREFLARALGRPNLKLGRNFLLGSSLRTDMHDRANWPDAAAWFAQQSPIYERALEMLQRR